MMRKKLLSVILGILTAIATLLSITSAYQSISLKRDFERFPAPGKLVDVDGYRLHFNCTGHHVEGTPTVVFEGGLGGPSLMWTLVQSEVSMHTRACTYDRAGYAWSDTASQPRTAQAIVNDLHLLLEQAGESPPYVLVGHSFGGAIIRLYASQYPDEVAALVLVDARHEDFFQRMPPEFLEIDKINLRKAIFLRIATPLGWTRIVGSLGLLEPFTVYIAPLPDDTEAVARAVMIYNPQHWANSIAERDVIEQSYDQVRDSTLPGNLPIIVLTAENGVEAWQTANNQVDQAQRDAWMQMQKELSELTARGKWIIVEDSGHYLYMDRPDAVIDAILSTLSDWENKNVGSN